MNVVLFTNVQAQVKNAVRSQDDGVGGVSKRISGLLENSIF